MKNGKRNLASVLKTEEAVHTNIDNYDLRIDTRSSILTKKKTSHRRETLVANRNANPYVKKPLNNDVQGNYR